MMKNRILESHKNDFLDKKTREYKKIKESLNILKKYKNFYNAFCLSNKLSDNKIEELLTLSNKKSIISFIKKINNAIDKDVSKSFDKNTILKDIENEFIIIFKNFAKRDWAMEFLTLLDVKVCPYCNRSYTFTVHNKLTGTKSKAELDHYFPISKYPFMAISIFNIVPSCSLCNKGKSNNHITVDQQNILYPYEEGFDDEIVFSVESNRLDYITDLSQEFSIKLKSSSSLYVDIITSYNQAFKIDHLYSMHCDYVQELIRKKIVYNDSMIEEIYENHRQLFESLREVEQMALGNYTDIKDLGRRPLAKLTRDINAKLRI